MDIKAGYKTTEFWMTVLGEIANGFLMVQGYVDPKTGAVVGASLVGIYNILRALVKQPSITTLVEIKKEEKK